MKSVYMHVENAYIIVGQKPVNHFAKTFGDHPNMEYVQMYMNWLMIKKIIAHFILPDY